MSSYGLFDPGLAYGGFFDPLLRAEGWFHPSFIDSNPQQRKTIILGSDSGASNGTTFTASSIGCGTNNGGATYQYGGLRYQNVQIPLNARITSAILTLSSLGTAFGGTGTAWGYWYGEASVNAATFSSSARPDQRTKTSAKTPVLWDVTNGNLVATDVTSIIQEIVNQSGWVSGNALSIVGDGGASGNGLALFRDFTVWGDVSPLVITYCIEPEKVYKGPDYPAIYKGTQTYPAKWKGARRLY